MSEDILKDEIYISESMLIGILWNMPSLFSTYTPEKLSMNHLGNKIWKFYLGLGREMYQRGIQVFDDITVAKIVKEMNVQKQFKNFGEYETIEELMIATKDTEENFESYYEEVKKYSLLRGLRDFIGEKVTTKTKKYDYHNMTRQEIDNYWAEKLNKIQIENGDTKIQEYNLVENIDKLIEKLDDDNNLGLPFYQLENFNGVMNGWAKGVVYLLSAFSGMGKSSFVVFGIIMSCIKHKEKLVIIANEMDIEAYQKMLLITILGNPLSEELKEKYKKPFIRNTLDRGKFSDTDKERLEYAVKWIKDNVEDNELIKFIPMENYTMESVEQVLRYYKRKGYDYAVIDTCKPSENRGNKERWVQFVDDFETIYKLAKKDSLNMGLFCTVQNADSYINVRYLDYTCIGDAKKIKNTVDLCIHIRKVFDDEINGDKDRVLEVREYGTKKLVKLESPMRKTYYLVFISKNRRGLTNNNLPVMVMSVDLNTNTWKEVGYTYVVNDLG